MAQSTNPNKAACDNLSILYLTHSDSMDISLNSCQYVKLIGHREMRKYYEELLQHLANARENEQDEPNTDDRVEQQLIHNSNT